SSRLHHWPRRPRGVRARHQRGGNAMTTTADHAPDIIWDTLQPSTDGDVDWTQAICAQTDPEAFFPDKGGSTADAKRVCGTCPIRRACLEYALTHDERFGIWGGLSERER